MDNRFDTSLCAHDYWIIRDCFRTLVMDGLPEHDWVEVAENMVRDLTGATVVDPDIVLHIIRKDTLGAALPSSVRGPSAEPRPF